MQEIENRRSIRKYKSVSVPEELIEKIVKAGMLAPSSKNRQPWKFTIATDHAKEEALMCMKKGLEREKKEPLLPESAPYIGGAEHTLHIMAQASVLIFITGTLAKEIHQTLNIDERVGEICNAQSVGAAIENMTLTATEAGLGSLWICDSFFAQQELNEWLDTEGELYAILAVGYADESPAARPRKPVEEVVEWRK